MSDVYEIVDWLNFYLERSADSVIQDMFYNGWKSDYFVRNVLSFILSSKLFAAVYNSAGCMHNSQVFELGCFHENPEKSFQRYGGQVVVYSVFDKKVQFLYKIRT